MERRRTMSASSVIGDKVVNEQDEDLGRIEDIVLDVETNRIAYAVLAFGGFLGMGEKLFAIPWSALQLDQERKCFVLDLPKATFEDAPGFDKDHWPDLGTSEEEVGSMENHASHRDPI